MATHNLYSKRNNTESRDLSYTEIQTTLRNQIKFIVNDFLAFNHLKEQRVNLDIFFWHPIYHILTREHGKDPLYTSEMFRWDRSETEQIIGYLLHESEPNKVLDTLEVLFRQILWIEDFSIKRNIQIVYSAESAIEDLNTRLKENYVGYKFVNNTLIKIDSEFLYANVTYPTLSLLKGSDYALANEEFLKANDHFKVGNYKESINECLKSVESTIKIICSKQGYRYDQNDTFKKLLQILYDNNYVPKYLQTELTSLRSILESGVPTIRNKTSAHGQGIQKVDVSEQLTSYTLNVTGSTIKFLLDLLNIH